MQRLASATAACGVNANSTSSNSRPETMPACGGCRRRARTGGGEGISYSASGREPAPLAQQLAAYRNDLSTAAISLCPAIAEALAALDAQPACLLARLSGSGATCFGLFATTAAARAAADALGRDHPDWWVAATRLDTGGR